MNEIETLNILLSIISGGVMVITGLIIGLFRKVNIIDVKMNSHNARTDTKIEYLEKSAERIEEQIILLKPKRT